jgi:hypothetical protein
VQGRYVLSPLVCRTLLPHKFRYLVQASRVVDLEIVVVQPNGALTVELRGDCFLRARPWTQCDGNGDEDERSFGVGHVAVGDQGKAQRWSYLPWTTEIEESCLPMTVRLRLWNEAEGGPKEGTRLDDKER